MKNILKISILVCVLCSMSINSFARGTTYLNLNYTFQSMKLEEQSFDSKLSGGVTMGHSFYLHQQPILDMMFIGLDWFYLDLNGTKYDAGIGDIYGVEAAMQFGVSCTVTPIPKLDVMAYVRYAPTFSGAMFNNEILDEITLSGGYASMWVIGGSVGYGMVSLGVEARWGSSTHSTISGDAELNFMSDEMKVKLNSTRIYVGIRF